MKNQNNEPVSIEKYIILALITDLEYTKKYIGIFQKDFFEVDTARFLFSVIRKHYLQTGQIFGNNFQIWYYEQVNLNTIPEIIASEIEQDIFEDLQKFIEGLLISRDYLDQVTDQFIQRRKLELLQERLQEYIEKNDVEQANKSILEYLSQTQENDDLVQELDLSQSNSIKNLVEAFTTDRQNLIKSSGALGQLWNNQMVRGAFVGLMAPEKRGKTFMLLHLGMLALHQHRKVLFVQAGDMTQNQQLIRIATYLARKSPMSQFVGKQFIPVKDCIYNQLDQCDRPERECDFGLFLDANYTLQDLRSKVMYQDLVQAIKEQPEYRACYNCKQFQNHSWGTVLLKPIDLGNPLTLKEAKIKYRKFFIKNKRHFKLLTYSNGTLTVSLIDQQIKHWKLENAYIPDVIIIDYADLLVCNKYRDFRQSQNEIWKQLRGLSQKYNCLVITATQTDAKAYDSDTISLSNYSEDKRKYAHVTAMYGMNQDKSGREKKLGVLRINELLVREGDSNHKVVYVLQDLKRGRPVITSYF